MTKAKQLTSVQDGQKGDDMGMYEERKEEPLLSKEKVR